MNNKLFKQEQAMSEWELIEKLTKREYFAALAFQSLLKNSAWIEFSQRAEDRGTITDKTLKVAQENSAKIADISIKYADTLLARLKAEGEPDV